MKKSICIFMIIFGGVMASFSQQMKGVGYFTVAWSPDSKYLSFTRMEFKDSKMKSDIYTVKVSGTEARKMTGDDKNEVMGSWSADGTSVLFGIVDSSMSRGELYSVGADGSGFRTVTKSCNNCSSPAMSPDGKYIAYNTETVAHKPQINVMNLDGGNASALTNDKTVAFYSPVWSPDSRALVYYTDKEDKKDQIWSMNADGTGKKLLTNNIGHNFYPSWTSDGKRIIFCSNRDGEEQVIYSMNADGSDIKRLMTANSSYARMSPNGKMIAFIAGRFPATAIYVAGADGSNPVKITP